MSVISSLLSRLRVADPPSVEEEPLPPLDPAAVRHRMIPPETHEAGWPAPTTVQQPQSYVLPLRSSPPSMASLPWQGEIADAEWKPVVLSELEMSIPTIPSLDELAEEGGISPDEPRFPFDT